MMKTLSAITRRNVLAAGLTAPMLIAGVMASAQGTALRFRAIDVDISPLDRYGGAGSSGRLLQQVLLGEMRKVFVDRMDPRDARAPTLTARITNLYIAPYDGAQTTDAFGGNDNIEGEGVVSIGTSVLSTTHILTELPPSYSGSLVTANLDAVRYQSIAYQFAYWLRREMGL